MRITFKKTDQGAVMAITRDHGEVAVRSYQTRFFAVHDLTHYAVETVLGLRNAFWGLLRQGWDWQTFEDKSDPRYPQLPREALWVEHVVSVLFRRVLEPARSDPEVRTLWVSEINHELAACLSTTGIPHVDLTSDQLVAIGGRLTELVERWNQLSIGEHLELEF